MYETTETAALALVNIDLPLCSSWFCFCLDEREGFSEIPFTFPNVLLFLNSIVVLGNSSWQDCILWRTDEEKMDVCICCVKRRVGG